MFIFKDKKIHPEGLYLSNAEKILFLLFNPSWIFFVHSWLKSLQNKSSTDLAMPWFTYKAINWLNKYLNKEMIVFEYGSGGSTLYLSNKVKELYSIEHNENWFKQVKRKLGSNRMNNVKVYLKKPIYKKSLKDVICKSTTFNQYLKYDFKEYVEAIDKFPDNYFDLIIIDGRARSSCIKHSVKKVKKNGYLLLDNSERLNYQSAINLLSKFKRTDYFGFGPTLNTFWQTSIWKK